MRHLEQHAAGKEASPVPVVNPVPHLERNNGEKMFDTMTNHAVSSNLPRRDSTISAKVSHVFRLFFLSYDFGLWEDSLLVVFLTELCLARYFQTRSWLLFQELEELPKYVAEQARYACSVCGSVTAEDTLYMHLTYLHPELKEVGYDCPHCRDRAIPPIPLDRNMIPHHLKMHDNTLYKCPYCTFHHYQR